MATEKIFSTPKQPAETVAKPPPDGDAGETARSARQMRRFLLATVALVLCFGVPLFQLATFALGNEFYSYVLLMPVVSWYLTRLQKPAARYSAPMTGVGVAFLIAGAVALGAYFGLVRPTAGLDIENYLSITVCAFYLLLLGVAGVFLGRETLRTMVFPLGILIFMVPMPVVALDKIITFLQYGSAFVTDAMFRLSLSTYSRHGLIFDLPGTPGLEVAPECSGIHSTWILLITSLLAGHLFLRSQWHRAILALAILPLALLRNGFRIFTIGQLCVHIGPQMIDSPIHRRGGLIFFALSLIPFLLFLIWLRKRETRGRSSHPTQT